MSNSVLFLFAHQDDEIGVLYQIEKEIFIDSSIQSNSSRSDFGKKVNDK